MIDDPKQTTIIKLEPDPAEYIEAENEFFQALGRCTNHWAFVDRQIYRIFQHSLGVPAMRASILYYRQRSLGQRLQLVDSLLKTEPGGDWYRDEWKPIYSKIQDLILTRNILVHHPALRRGTSKNGKPIYIYSIHIEPYEKMLGKNQPGLQGKDQLHLEDLIAHGKQVTEIEDELNILVSRLRVGSRKKGA